MVLVTIRASIGGIRGLEAFGEFRLRAAHGMVPHGVQHACEELRHVAVDAAHLLVMSVWLRVCCKLAVALSALRVIVLFPPHRPAFAAMHLMAAQTTHATLETQTL